MTVKLAKKVGKEGRVYGIYDCSSQNMIYTRYVEFDGKPDPKMTASSFPSLNIQIKIEIVVFQIYSGFKDL